MLHYREFVNWARIASNRPARELDEAAFLSLYEHRGEPLCALPPWFAQSCALLCVLTTYRRPAAAQGLLAQLEAELAETDARLLVLNDRSDADYVAVRSFAEARFGERVLWLDARERLGKPGFWRAYQVAFLVAARLRPAHALFVQDDLTLGPDFLRCVYAQWQATSWDERRRVLYLFSSDQDERFGRWTLSLRRDVAPGLRRTQWFDLQAFFVDLAFFEALSFRLVPIHENRWRRQRSVSSGVGLQLTFRLRGRGNVYQSYPPLVRHGALASEMNPQARARRALDNRGVGRPPRPE